jgi:hypothetical protein
VTFLSSYAIRVLLVGAKIVDGKSGKPVVLFPERNVVRVLKTAGTDALIPVLRTQEAAASALTEQLEYPRICAHSPGWPCPPRVRPIRRLGLSNAVGKLILLEDGDDRCDAVDS